jgi:DNA-directed RNA polymerase subunit E'/Rpb7
MDPLFERRELTRKVHIHPKFLQKNMLPSILAQLKMNVEGRCSSEGYIQQDSVTILKYGLGRVKPNGSTDYEVSFQADVCFPHPGQIFRASAELRTKIGIHAELTPLKVLIPRDLHIGNADFDSLEDGQEFEFEVIGPQFKQQDKSIVVVGRLRSALKPAPLQPLLRVESKVEIPTMASASSSAEEKLVTVQPVENPVKKTRKLKKPNIVDLNESLKTGMDEGTN